MKKIWLSILSLLSGSVIQAQLVITPGAELNISGNTQLTISNMDFINNGKFTAGNGTEFWTGNTSSVPRGSQATPFYNVEINKNGGAALTLH